MGETLAATMCNSPGYDCLARWPKVHWMKLNGAQKQASDQSDRKPMKFSSLASASIGPRKV
jgi:hypothetical protein